MAIKITYTDSTTNEVLAEDLIVDEEIKALGVDMISSNPKVVFGDWYRNAIHNKSRQMIDEICKQALEDKTHTILSLADKQLLQTYLNNQGIVFTTVKQFPDNIKREIVKRANIQSAAERQAEKESQES